MIQDSCFNSFQVTTLNHRIEQEILGVLQSLRLFKIGYMLSQILRLGVRSFYVIKKQLKFTEDFLCYGLLLAHALYVIYNDFQHIFAHQMRILRCVCLIYHIGYNHGVWIIYVYNWSNNRHIFFTWDILHS